MTLPIRIANNIDFDKSWTQGRRLVINIGGAKIFGKYIFRQKILKKFPSILSKNFNDLFF